jgi:nucleoside-diphosphate-sugar epimerase
MTTLVIGSGLIGSQIARILVERGEKPVLMDSAAQPQAINQIVDLGKVTMVVGDVLRPLSIIDVLHTHGITKIAHTAANPLLTLGAQREPYSAINLNIMGTVNVLEAARVTGLKRVVVSSSSVLNHYLAGGDDGGNFGREEAFPRPTTFYSATKQAVESLGLNYAKWCGIEFAGLRYGAVFGPWSGAGGGGPSNIIREASGRGAGRAAAGRRTSSARRCGTRSPARKRPSRPARWSGSIPRMRRAAPSWRSMRRTSAMACSTSPWVR